MNGIDFTAGVISAVIYAVVFFMIVKSSDSVDLRDNFTQLNKPWYWTWYNISEWAWIFIRMAILVPVVVFGNMIWELYYLGFIAATGLTWVSIKKKLPEFTVYYSFWVWMSASVVLSHWIK